MTTLLPISQELARLARDLATASERLEALARSLAAQEGLRQRVQQPHGATQAGPARLLTVPEVMQRLAIGRATVYELIRTGQLESVKIGRSRRVTEDALTRYVDAQERSSRT